MTADDQAVPLGPTEFRLLRFLLARPERVHSRTQLLDQVWGDYVSPEVWRPDAQRYLPLPPNEYYAYVGIWPFLAAALLPRRRGFRRGHSIAR